MTWLTYHRIPNQQSPRSAELLRRVVCAICLIAFAFQAAAVAQDNVPYKNPDLAVEQRVQDLLQRMTLEEKAAMLAGSGWMESSPIARLGIPAIKMADGPLGVRLWTGSSAITSAKTSGPAFTSTAFPAGIALAASWDPDLAQRVGQGIAQEVKAVGRDMILGPTVNIQRTPLWGRNFEGYGEDPYLTARIAVGYIKGVQGEGVIATVKHFAANNQEFERHRVNAVVDERALQEIYFPAFKAAVQEAGVWSVMSAYNRLNGTYCAENADLLKGVLKKDWGFKGFVVSDWGSTYSTADTVNAGMDLEMPGGQPARKWLALPATQKDGNSGDWLAPEKVLAAVSAGKISGAAIDDNVSRLLRVMFVSGIFDHPHSETSPLDTPSQRALARSAAAEGIVLLRNYHALLPLDLGRVHSIAVIGPAAATARIGGGGSSLVRSRYAVSPLDGIKERAGTAVQVNYALGTSMEGENRDQDTPEARVLLRKQAVAVAENADVAIVVVGDSTAIEGESFDRKTLDLPAGQDDLIQAVAKANRNTVVVINAGGPVNVSRWVEDVRSVVDAWFGGQEAGHALADVLFGDVNPSGKLPFSFIDDWKQSPAFGNYPGENLRVKYAEGIYVGYRYFEKHNIMPRYPFGYGLSYTSFEYSDLKIAPRQNSQALPVLLSVRVRNRGSRAGAEVVQLYLHERHASVDRPLKELKGFHRVELAPGEAKTVSFTLDQGSMAFYSTAKKQWVAEPAQFEVMVGASSRDISLKGTFDLGH